MTFVKERISDEDRAAYAAKGIRILPSSIAWAIDREKDAFLIKIGQDRYDMGGTTHTWWDFYYDKKLFRITCDIGITPKNTTDLNYYEVPIVAIEIYKNTELREYIIAQKKFPDEGREFLNILNEGYKIYKSYGDISPNNIMESINNTYNLIIEENKL